MKPKEHKRFLILLLTRDPASVDIQYWALTIPKGLNFISLGGWVSVRRDSGHHRDNLRLLTMSNRETTMTRLATAGFSAQGDNI